MQLPGSLSQSILHMNLSQCSQPMVGVRARPLSKASAAGLVKLKTARRKTALHIFCFAVQQTYSKRKKQLPVLRSISSFKTCWARPLRHERHLSGPINSKCVCSSPMECLLLPAALFTVYLLLESGDTFEKSADVIWQGSYVLWLVWILKQWNHPKKSSIFIYILVLLIVRNCGVVSPNKTNLISKL